MARLQALLPASFAPIVERVTTLTPGAALALGVLSLGWGATLWRFVSTAIGLGVGGLFGWRIGEALGDARVGWVAAAACGLGLAALFYLVERAAVAGMGGTVGVALATWTWPLIQHQEADWVVRVGGAIVGAAVASALHTRALQALTSFAGAALVAWALGFPGQPGLILVLGGLGTWFQMRGKGRKE